jgi:translation initiation factor IF-2
LAKTRVYELAKELGLESKVVLARAQELGIEVKTASSGLDEDGVSLVKLSYQEAAAPTEAEGVSEAPAEVEVPGEAEAPAEPEATPVEIEEEAPAETEAEEPSEERVIEVTEGVTAHEFGRLIGERTGEIVRELMNMGQIVPGGGQIPVDAIEPLGAHFGWEVLVEHAPEVETVDEGPRRSMVEYEDDPASLEPRPPVVVIMGHVDHGKTQLLDSIRSANVVAGEAGGITQHIGAYQIDRKGSKITFIDTPGHEAFTALRARGADVTDIAIIVVAANDGVMPQTVEAINHAKAAAVPIIVAINKMDLESADPVRVRAALTQHDLVVEELGGDIVSAEISALTGAGVDELLEMISIVAEVEELTANPKAAAVGTVVESQLEVGRGAMATVIVQRGTLKKGDALVAGAVSGRVRAMFDENGKQMASAGPSTPVLLTGWGEVPSAGDMFQVVQNERIARKLADAESDRIRAADFVVPTATERLTTLLETLRTEDHAELLLVVKADAHGSLEALRDAVGKIKRDDGKVSIIHAGVGGITANDVMLAEASEGIIYGFNARPDSSARKAAKERAIDVRTFSRRRGACHVPRSALRVGGWLLCHRG